METPPDPFNASIAYREDLTHELAIIRIRPDSGQVPAFTPGQFCTLGLPADPAEVPLNAPARPGRGPRLVRRSYSIGSSADERGWVELYVVLVPDGRLTPKLWSLPVGGRLFMAPNIAGHFTLEGVPADRDLVMISTGTGLAPYVSMLRTYRGRGEKRWRRLVLIHGARLCGDLGYRGELEAVAREDPSFIYIPSVTREPEGSIWAGMRGRVQAALEPATYDRLVGEPLTPDRAHVFLCGNPEMIEAVRVTLEGRGFVTKTRDQPEGNLHFERYW